MRQEFTTLSPRCFHYPASFTPESPRIFCWAYINATRKDGSKMTQATKPYSKPSFRKLLPEIRTAKNVKSTKRRILDEHEK